MKTNKELIVKLTNLIKEAYDKGYKYTISHSINHILNIESNKHGVFRIKNTIGINKFYKEQLDNGKINCIEDCIELLDDQFKENNIIAKWATNLHNAIKSDYPNISWHKCFNYTLVLFTLKALQGILAELHTKEFVYNKMQSLYPLSFVEIEDASFFYDARRKMDFSVKVDGKRICGFSVKPEKYTKTDYYTNKKALVMKEGEKEHITILKEFLNSNQEDNIPVHLITYNNNYDEFTLI